MDNLDNNYREKSAGEVERIVKEAFFNDDEESAYEETNRFLSLPVCSGSPDEFHNLSVNYSKKDDYATACRILERGLERYPYCTDLLADYLQIGLFCNKEEECKKYYKTLFSISKEKWTWRGFSFSIDYLQYITEETNNQETINENKDTMLSIADDYARYFSHEEDVYLSRSGIFSYFNDKDQEIMCLQTAVDRGLRSPKCNLKLADFYFSQGNYKKALEYIERNIVEGIDVQDRINIGYMYYLSGLCRTALLNIENNFSDRKAVMRIFQDFYIAEETADNITSYLKNIERQVFILETKTGIKYQDAIDCLFSDDNTSYFEEDTTDDTDNNTKTKSRRSDLISKMKFGFHKNLITTRDNENDNKAHT